MSMKATVLEILKQLDKSNCRECGMPTCLAFATAVHQGNVRLAACPRLDADARTALGGDSGETETLVEKADRAIRELQNRVSEIDLEAAAARIGASFENGRLTIRCLGKPFSVDTEGKIHTALHVNTWIAVPALNYILHGGKDEPEGEWVAFRDLPRGMTWRALFEQRCEKTCKRVADANPEFFDDLVRLFEGEPAGGIFQSDTALILKPLPRLPLLIAYWKPDGELPSQLNLFFDRTAERHLSIDLIYVLCTGLGLMFEKIARHHGQSA